MYIGEFLDFAVPPMKHMVVSWKANKRAKEAYDGELALLSPPQSPSVKTGEVLPGDLKQPFGLKIFLLFFIPTVVDVIGSTLYNLGLKYALVSVCQMVRNCSVLFVALFSAIAFKQYRLDFDLPQVVGILMVIAGLLGICVTSMLLDGD